LNLLKFHAAQANAKAAAHSGKLVADQRYAAGQNNSGFCILSCGNYGNCFQNGKGVPIDLRAATHYFKLAADQRYPAGQSNYGSSLLNGTDLNKLRAAN
jgi:TPR repeat protein